MLTTDLKTTRLYSIELSEFFYNYDNYYLVLGQNDENPWIEPYEPDYWYPEFIEFARIKYTEKNYVAIDPNGHIGLETEKWSISFTPTRYLYLGFIIPDSVINAYSVRQLGIVKGTVTISGEYNDIILPQDIEEKGRILWNQNTEPFSSLALVENKVDYILSF